jgi:hypothetical protein
VGQRFVGFTSTDGTTWTAVVDVPEFVVAANAYVGVVATSGTEGTMASVVIENVTITPPVTPLPVRPDAAAPSDATPDGGVVDAAAGN